MITISNMIVSWSVSVSAYCTYCHPQTYILRPYFTSVMCKCKIGTLIMHNIIKSDSIIMYKSIWKKSQHTEGLKERLNSENCTRTSVWTALLSGQIDWQAQKISHLACSSAGQSCSEAWETFLTWTGQSITALIAWRKEEWRKKAADIPPSKVGNDLCSTRQISALFREQPWGDC